MNTRLDEIIREVTSKSPARVSRAIEKMAEEAAKEILSDPEFRESLHALVRAAAKRIMADLTTPLAHGEGQTTVNNL